MSLLEFPSGCGPGSGPGPGLGPGLAVLGAVCAKIIELIIAACGFHAFPAKENPPDSS